jgi:aspartate/methionine/tyrosine aminotransferase
MVVGGPQQARQQALAALDIVADAFLSVGAPVQVAAPALLEQGSAIRRQIRSRLAANLARAHALGRQHPWCTILPVEGGWSLVLRVPATRAEESIVLTLLERDHILVHPGYFFDFPHEAFIVISLLPPEDVFAPAFERVLQCVGDEARR